MAVAEPGKVHPYAQPGSREQALTGGRVVSVANDVISRADELATQRTGWEREWKDIADYVLPTASRQMLNLGGGLPAMMDKISTGPATRETARRRFDSTAMWAVDRLSAGVESLVAPQSEKWHGLTVEDVLSAEPTDQEERWFERVRDFLFMTRYDAVSGFATSFQKAVRSTCAFGTGVTYIEEAWGSRRRNPEELPCLYRYLPLSQCYMATNAQGEVDTLCRRYAMSARQLVQQFGEKVSAKVKALESDPKKCDTLVEIVHAVMPRKEYGSREAGTVRGAEFASYYVEVDGAHLIGDGGFFEFPFAIFHWVQSDEGAYGESPVMLALDDIRGINVMKRSGLRSMQQWVDPPLAVAHDGVMNRPNLNPRAVNHGAIDANGRLKIQPIITAQRPDLVQSILEQERNGIRETLYLNLFQILVQNPQMTATEAMLRSNEKGELLGPSGAKIQAGLARMVDREISILDRKGAFDQGASLEAPESILGRRVGTRFTSPLDRLRRMQEMIGTQRTLEVAMAIAKAGKPDVMLKFDFDAVIDLAQDVFGAPKKIMRPDADVQKDRDDAAKAAKAALLAQLAEQAGAGAKEAAGAAREGNQLAREAQNDPPVGPQDVANAMAAAEGAGIDLSQMMPQGNG